MEQTTSWHCKHIHAKGPGKLSRPMSCIQLYQSGRQNAPEKKETTILLCKWKATFRNFKWHWDGTLLCRIVLTTFVIPLKPAVASECPWCDLPVWTSNGVSRPRAKHARTEPTSMGSPKAVPARVYKICKYLWSTLHWTWLAGRSPYELCVDLLKGPLLYALLIARKCSQAL